MCHLIIMNTWGYLNSFGIFQNYYSTVLTIASPFDISWIGSTQVFLLFFIGTFSGPLADAGYFHLLLVVGCLISVIGIFMTSLCSQYWQLLLAQGICCGVGSGCLFCPCMSVLSTYFTTKRNLAMALAAGGSGTGGIIFPAIAERLLPTVGFPWTIRSLGFIQLGCFLICYIGLRSDVTPKKARSLVDFASFGDATYVLFTAGMFLVSKLFWV